jgi:hypothetical protein
MILPVPWTQAELDRRIDEVLVDACGEGEELGAWAVALGDPIRPALSATVMGIPVELVSVEPPEWRGGLRARCRREGRTWTVALADVSINASASAEFLRTLAAYRRYIRCAR